jgi:hypothetical protein
MFEEVPRERRGVARLLPVRRVVLGPFVLGGGMLVAALGGSVAVAAAATMITASAIGSDNDLPARPGQVVAPSTSTDESVSARRTPARQAPARPAAGQQPPTPPAAGVATSHGATGVGSAGGVTAGGSVPGGGGAGVRPGLSSVAPPLSTAAAGSETTERTAAPSTPAGSPAPTPSSSGPLGNAVIRVSGYDQASSRLVYQFATVRPRAGIDGGDLYLISGRQSFSAALAPSMTITSGGSICPPAGSACTPDQLINAAESGFFAQVAIDAAGVLRSIIEVGGEPATAKMSPAPSTSAQLDGNRRGRTSSSPPVPSATS